MKKIIPGEVQAITNVQKSWIVAKSITKDMKTFVPI